jgi:hypothetical protein
VSLMQNYELFEPRVHARMRHLLACCQRELAYRRRVYPRLVELQKMSPRTAEKEIGLMLACVNHFMEMSEQ